MPLRAIPSVESIPDTDIRLVLQAIKENVEVIGGQRGDILDRATLVSQLKNIGVVGVADGRLYNPNSDALPGFTELTAAQQASTSSASSGGLSRATLDATAGLTVATHSMILLIPTNAIITRAFYEVITTFVSGTDAATIALGLNTDDTNGIVAPIAISDVSNPWDAGYFDAIEDGAAANFSVKTTAARLIEAVVGVEALTDGKLNLFVEYVLSPA